MFFFFFSFFIHLTKYMCDFLFFILKKPIHLFFHFSCETSRYILNFSKCDLSNNRIDKDTNYGSESDIQRAGSLTWRLDNWVPLGRKSKLGGPTWLSFLPKARHWLVSVPVSQPSTLLKGLSHQRSWTYKKPSLARQLILHTLPVNN